MEKRKDGDDGIRSYEYGRLHVDFNKFRQFSNLSRKLAIVIL